MNDPSVSDPVVVLYIDGAGRSGSTILAALLGNHTGFCPVGEIRAIWKALKTDQLCGCGDPFSSCNFWSHVGEKAFGGWDRVDADDMLTMDGRFARHRRIPRLLIASFYPPRNDAFWRYCEVLTRLYAAVRSVSGCSVIVDSSKDPPYGLLLRQVPGLDVRFIHLVRDSRGVAYSESKRGVVRPEHADSPILDPSLTFMPNWRPWRSALNWDLKNLAVPCTTPAASRRIVKYESLMSGTSEELTRLLRFSDEIRTNSQATTLRQHFDSLPFHTLEGNPVRFARGTITLREDAEWRIKMPFSQRLVVSTLTLPLLITYGYIRLPALHRRPGPK
jgi:hypothetical protein